MHKHYYTTNNLGLNIDLKWSNKWLECKCLHSLSVLEHKKMSFVPRLATGGSLVLHRRKMAKRREEEKEKGK